jgi:sialic acid synthase SpsE
LKAGDYITEDAVRSIRPGYGMHPKYRTEIVGKITTQDIECGTAVDLKLIKHKEADEI